jgi:hypothetical protein
MPRTVQYALDDEDFVLSSDETSNDEEDDLTNAFTAKIDKDWQPIHAEKIPRVKNTRPVRKAAGGVKIYSPNTGLEASKIVGEDKSHQFSVTKKLNVAISSSEEEN